MATDTSPDDEHTFGVQLQAPEPDFGPQQITGLSSLPPQATVNARTIATTTAAMAPRGAAVGLRPNGGSEPGVIRPLGGWSGYEPMRTSVNACLSSRSASKAGVLVRIGLFYARDTGRFRPNDGKQIGPRTGTREANRARR